MGVGIFKGSTGYSAPVIDEKTKRVTIKPKIDDIDMQKTGELIKEAKMIQADPYRDEIKLQDEKILPEMQSIIDKAKALKDALYKLSNQLNPTRSSSSVFNQKECKRTLSTGASADPFIQFVIDDPKTVQNQTYSFNIKKLAIADQITGTVPLGSSHLALGFSNDLLITTVDSDYTTPLSTNIDITSDMSLQNVVDKINQSSLNGVLQASIIKVSDNDYQLSIQSTVTGRPITLGTSPGYTDPALTDFGLRAGNDLTQPTVNSLRAEVEYNGVTVYRHTNSFDDLVTGVTINLLGITEPNKANIAVDYDKVAAFKGINDFVVAYTELNDILIKNNKTDANGEKDPDAILFGEQILSMTKSLLLSNFGNSLAGAEGDDLVAFASVGIKFKDFDPNKSQLEQAEGAIEIKPDILEKSLLNNFEKVIKLFGQSHTSDNKNFVVFDIPKDLATRKYQEAGPLYGKPKLAGVAISITLSETSPGVYAGLFDDGRGNTESIPMESDVFEPGAASFFSGLVIGYNGPKPTNPGTYTASIKVTQGLADCFQVALGEAVKPKVIEGGVIKSIGTFANEVEKIGNKQENLKKRIEEIEKQANAIVERLNKSMGNLYEQQNQTTSIINMLNAMHAGRDK